ncbi:hypothetical protein ABH931_003622 [Streptacidiphilus sp. MAP12-33]
MTDPTPVTDATGVGSVTALTGVARSPVVTSATRLGPPE